MVRLGRFASMNQSAASRRRGRAGHQDGGSQFFINCHIRKSEDEFSAGSREGRYKMRWGFDRRQ